MEIEKQRGISVSSTVLSFEYKKSQGRYHLNLLDTPGHQVYLVYIIPTYIRFISLKMILILGFF